MTTNAQQWMTLAFCVGLVLATIIYDVAVHLVFGPQATVSRTLQRFSLEYPLGLGIVLVSIGIVIGHICYPQYLR